MNVDRSKAPRGTRFPFSLVGALSKKWEGKVQGFLTEMNNRGETRLEEISRELRQTEAWLRILATLEKAERSREATKERWSRLGNRLLGRAGIATEVQLEELVEELGRLAWRVDRITRKVEEDQPPRDIQASGDEAYRSLG